MPPKKSLPGRLKPWKMVLDDVRAKNPHLSLKEAMIVAKPIYAQMKQKLGL